MLNWFLERLLQDLLIDYFDDEVEVFHNFLMMLLNLLLLFMVLLHLLVMLFLGFILSLFLFLFFCRSWWSRSQGLFFLELFLLLLKRIRPLILKFFLVNVVLDLHLDIIIMLEVIEDLFEQNSRDFISL